MDPQKKFFLFKQSKTFCSVPWNYFKIDTDGSVMTCVKGSVRLGNINDTDIEEILHSVEIKKIRESLYQGDVPINCQSCQKFDNNENQSDYKFLRDMYNDWFKKINVDYSDFDAFHMSGVDLHWSNTCNIKCVTCWPKQSSAIASELGYPIHQIPRDHIEKITDWILHHQGQIREIYFSGGEPTLIKHNIRLLEELEPRDDLILRINTNMTFDRENKFIKNLEKFTNVIATMSADALGDRLDQSSRVCWMLSSMIVRHDHDPGYADYVGNKFQNYMLLKNFARQHPSCFLGFEPGNVKGPDISNKISAINEIIARPRAETNGRVFDMTGDRSTLFDMFS